MGVLYKFSGGKLMSVGISPMLSFMVFNSRGFSVTPRAELDFGPCFNEGNRKVSRYFCTDGDL